MHPTHDPHVPTPIARPTRRSFGLRRRVASLSRLRLGERASLAAILQSMQSTFDRVFKTPFPYCSGWHSAGLADADEWQLHAHYYPPLLRSAAVAKIPASYEVLGEIQRDFTPECAAAQLRDVAQSEK